MSLEKTMSIGQGIVLAICTLVGSGLLGLPGLAIETAGPQTAAVAWPISILVSLPLVVIFLSLSLNVQDSGGIARYAGLALGTRAQSATTFILAVTFMLCIPLGTYMGAVYVQKILGIPDEWRVVIAALVLGATTVVNAFGVRPASWINKASAFSLVALVAMLAASRPELIPVGLAAYEQHFAAWSSIEVGNLWAACALLFWAFLGWENLSFGSEEIRGGRRAITIVFFSGFLIVSLIYGLLAIIATGAAAQGGAVAGVSGLLSILDDGPFKNFSHILIILIVVANVNSWVFAASRLMYASGRDRLLPSFLGNISSNGVPRVALFTMLVMYTVLSLMIATDVIPLSLGLMVANQNFIIIYLVVILCYAKRARHPYEWIVALCAAGSSGLLVVGFRNLLVIPLVLGGLGYVIAKRREASLQTVG